MRRSHRGFAGALERAWSGEPGAWGWTRVLLPAAAAYAAASSVARRRASRARRGIAGLYVVAVGSLTVGGAGKSSLARWLALEAIAGGARAAILLRGHGAGKAHGATEVVPDFDGYPFGGALKRCGDDAVAHRAALPRSVAVAVDRDRRRAALAVRSGYGAAVAVLDDGWEQPRLLWNELWVLLDPHCPRGNGWALPAGPLRRPTETLREADVVAFVLEGEEEDVPESTLQWTAARAPGAAVVRFRRALHGVSGLGGGAVEAWERDWGPAVLVSGVGAPGRLERFARSSGIEFVHHAAFPDHARWERAALEPALAGAAAQGARIALVTEKDEARWPAGVRSTIPVRVLRASLRPIDPTDAALFRVRAAAAGGGGHPPDPIGSGTAGGASER